MSNLPPVLLAEFSEPPQTWLKNQLSAAKEYLKEAWEAFCSMLRVFGPLERQVVTYSADIGGSEERIAVSAVSAYPKNCPLIFGHSSPHVLAFD